MNEIITYGQFYELNNGIKAFVQSAKKTGNIVTVICHKLNKSVIDYLIENKCNYVDARDLAKKYGISHQTAELSPFTLKVILAYVYLKKESKASNVYICDFTDIYFQKNIFDYVKEKPTVFEEGKAVKECPVNTEWIQICYNNTMLSYLNDKLIINGGGILGDIKSCTALLEDMCKEIPGINEKTNNYANIDQAILNKIIYTNENKYYIESYDKVLNMAHYKNKYPVTIKDGLITANNVIPAVIHQYDCDKSIQKFITNKFK